MRLPEALALVGVAAVVLLYVFARLHGLVGRAAGGGNDDSGFEFGRNRDSDDELRQRPIVDYNYEELHTKLHDVTDPASPGYWN